MISLYKLSAIFFSLAVILFVVGILLIRMQGSGHETNNDGPSGYLSSVADVFLNALWLTVICGLLVMVSLVLLLYAWWKG